MASKKYVRKTKSPSTKAKQRKKTKRASGEALLQRTMPKWRLSKRVVSDAEASSKADAVSPPLESLQSKFLKADDSNASSPIATKTKRAAKAIGKLVVMEPEAPSDAAVIGPKTQVLEDDEHIGSQG